MAARGRPRLFKESQRIHVILDARDYEVLGGEMLEAYRRRRPRAHIGDLVRRAVADAVADWREKAGERDGIAARRRDRVRKLAASLAEAPDGKVEQRARRLAALIEAEGPAA